MRALAWQFDVYLSFTSLEELVATPSESRRLDLLQRFKRLLRPGKCIVPPAEIFRLMAAAHSAASGQFDWMNVDVATEGFLDVDDLLSAEQGAENKDREAKFKECVALLRRGLGHLPITERPSCYRDVAAIMSEDQDSVWKLAQGLYRRASGTGIDEPLAKAFLQACPPCRALCIGQMLGVYSSSLRGSKDGRPAGLADLLMSVYLPYCDQFVTNDPGQRNALTEVANCTGISCRVLLFDEFTQGVSRSA